MKCIIQKCIIICMVLMVTSTAFSVAVTAIETGSTTSSTVISNRLQTTKTDNWGTVAKVDNPLANEKAFGYAKTNLSIDALKKIKAEPKASNDPIIKIANDNNIGQTDKKKPDFRESIIVYFKEMPGSMDKFASSYGVTPLFVKDDIRMAAFESSPQKEPGITSKSTKDSIEKISKDPIVESVKEDTSMFINKKSQIKAEANIVTPKDCDRNGTIYSQNKVVVGFWRFPASLDKFAEKYGGKLIDLTDGDLSLQKAVFETSNSTDFINKISNDPYIKYAYPDMVVGHVTGYTPNDAYWNTDYHWGQKNIYCPEAWDYQKGSTSIRIAIVDTGVDDTHPDLHGRVVKGADYINGGNDPIDDNGHGTEMAGIAAAIMDNSIGFAGVSQSTILSIKSMDSAGNVWTNALVEGINYAAENSAKIISISAESDNFDGLQQAIDDAYVNHGCVIVASTGNDGIEVAKYPAAFDNVIAVGAIDKNGARWSNSNYGSYIDLMAPGFQVGTTNRMNAGPGMQYVAIDGTSPAAAFVSGVAALVLAENPTMPQYKVREYLINSAQDLGPSGFDNQYGYGKVNAYGAVTWARMTAAGSFSIPDTNYGVGLQLSVPANSYVTTVMAGNENSDFDIVAKWNAWPTSSDYDAISQSDGCLEGILTPAGSGTLYIIVYSYSGSGNFKIWSVSGRASSSQLSMGTLPGPGYVGISTYTGNGKGYVFNSGPDGSNFDLYTKWNAQPTPYSYDALGNSPEAQEYAGPVLNSGTLYSAVFANSGSGEFRTISAIF